jgi:hypothetical protein
VEQVKKTALKASKVLDLALKDSEIANCVGGFLRDHGIAKIKHWHTISLSYCTTFNSLDYAPAVYQL